MIIKRKDLKEWLDKLRQSRNNSQLEREQKSRLFSSQMTNPDVKKKKITYHNYLKSNHSNNRLLDLEKGSKTPISRNIKTS